MKQLGITFIHTNDALSHTSWMSRILGRKVGKTKQNRPQILFICLTPPHRNPLSRCSEKPGGKLKEKDALGNVSFVAPSCDVLRTQSSQDCWQSTDNRIICYVVVIGLLFFFSGNSRAARENRHEAWGSSKWDLKLWKILRIMKVLLGFVAPWGAGKKDSNEDSFLRD